MAQQIQDTVQYNGVLIVNKPKGPTSRQCLNRIQSELNQKKIGHAGTLDPLAQGVLPVLLGKGTKLAPYLGEGRKVYRGIFRLGLETDTYDIEGEVTGKYNCSHVTPEQIKEEMYSWLNYTEQVVPPYAAAKYKGQPMYSLKRKGREVPEKRKSIRIDQVEVLGIDFPLVCYRLSCSPGTYIRSLAHNLGRRLRCGAVLKELVREESYPFSLEQAHDLNRILEEPKKFTEKFLPLSESLPHWPKVYVAPEHAEKIKNGMSVNVEDIGGHFPAWEGQRAFFCSNENDPLALMETRAIKGRICWTILRGLWHTGGAV